MPFGNQELEEEEVNIDADLSDLFRAEVSKHGPSLHGLPEAASGSSDIPSYHSNHGPQEPIHPATTNMTDFVGTGNNIGLIGKMFIDDSERRCLGVLHRLAGATVNAKATCHVHRPRNSCICWVRLPSEDHLGQAVSDLQEWLRQGCTVGSDNHLDLSNQLKIKHGMRIRSTNPVRT